MRSLTTKLILAFLAVSLISIGVIVAAFRFSANREFNKFISSQYESELAEELANFYETNGTWDDIDKAYLGLTAMEFGPQEGRQSNFCVANADGIVVMESIMHKPGETLGRDILEKSIAIRVNNEVVGYLIIDRPPERRDPMEAEFTKRLDISLLLTALGTVVLAFIFGAILSRTITKPIRELTSATHAMAGGKLGQKVPVRSQDEIGELTESFNKMNDDLAKSFNLRKQMTADIAHELRTPLSLIIGHAEAVHDGVLPPTKQNFEIIREEAERLEKLVNDLRTLTLADAGELSLEFQLVDIHKLLGDIKAHYMIQLNQKRITLDLQPASEILKATLDPVRISQVLMNVLDNAIRYTPQDGQIIITTKQLENEIEIAIQDSGEGITPDEANHIFDRFYRADESRTRDEGGSGLGLAIAKSIVEMHLGRIWAESEPGKGLRTIVHLPGRK
jgi:signal transduction histidine kinase